MPPVRSPPRVAATLQDRWACDECNTTVSRKHDIKRHKLSCRGASSPKLDPVYTCRYDGCSHTSTQKSNIIAHEKTHILKDFRKKEKCPYFGLDGCVFATGAAHPGATIRRHIKKTHPLRQAEYEAMRKKSRNPSFEDSDDSEEMHYVDSVTISERAGAKSLQESTSRTPSNSYELLPHCVAMRDILSLAAAWVAYLERERQVDGELSRHYWTTSVCASFGSPTGQPHSYLPPVF